jgi:hypothetical protein
MKKINKKQLNIAISVFFTIYIVSYIVLSIYGKYTLDISGDTKVFNSVWPVHDVSIWQPKCLILGRNNWNYFGLIYMPLIELDRTVWHKDSKSINS